VGLSVRALSTMASTSSRDRCTCEVLLPYFCSTYSSLDSLAEQAIGWPLLLLLLLVVVVVGQLLLLVLALLLLLFVWSMSLLLVAGQDVLSWRMLRGSCCSLQQLLVLGSASCCFISQRINRTVVSSEYQKTVGRL